LQTSNDIEWIQKIHRNKELSIEALIPVAALVMLSLTYMSMEMKL
jgi:hypothetical protein